MHVLVFGEKGYLSNSLLFDKKKKFKVSLLSKKELKKKTHIKKKYDLIIHTLGANKFQSEKHKQKTLRNKISYTKKIIEYARINNIRKIIYISSINVYDVRNRSLNFIKSYSKAHITIENFLKNHESKKLKILILRISHLFGLRDTVKSKGKFLSLINNFIQCSLRRKKFIIRNRNAKINILPLSYFISLLGKLLRFKQNYKIIDICFLKIEILPLLQIVAKRIYKKIEISSKIYSKKNNYINIEKFNIPKNIKPNKIKILNQEIDGAIQFFIAKYLKNKI